MAHAYNISESGLDFIKAYEGFRPVETVLASGQKTIGYGHSYVRGEPALLTQNKAEDILKSDLEPIEKIINHIVFAPMSQNQFDALVSLAFNIGIDEFADSTILHYMNNGQPLAAAAGFDEWRKGLIADQTYVVDALVRRRTAEKALFLSPTTGIVTAPRYELPVLHDSTVKSGADDIEIFSELATEDFVDQAPYQTPYQAPYEEPAQARRSEDGPAGSLMLSERAATPQIYEEALDAHLANETDSDGGGSIEAALIDNVIEIKPDAEIVDAIEVEPEPAQDEGLSPIALAAANVSERLDNLMEDTETEAEVEITAGGAFEQDNLELDIANGNEAVEETEKAETSEAEPVEDAPDSTLKQPVLIAVEKENAEGVGAFWTTLIIGLLLISGSLWEMKFSAAPNMGEMGVFLAPVVLLVGAMLIMGGMFYMLKAQLRSAVG